MALERAVLWLDHHQGQVLQFNKEQVIAQKLRDHPHDTGQHHSAVRTEHEFFSSVCDALSGIGAVLVTASRTVQADFRHYVSKHRPGVSAQLVGWETVDRPTEGELIAMAKKFFNQQDQLLGEGSRR